MGQRKSFLVVIALALFTLSIAQRASSRAKTPQGYGPGFNGHDIYNEHPDHSHDVCEGPDAHRHPECRNINVPKIYILNDQEDLLNVDPKEEFTLNFAIDSNEAIAELSWRLDPAHHRKAEDDHFFSIVKPAPHETALIIPERSKLPEKDYYIEITAKNKHGRSSSTVAHLRIHRPSVELSVEVEPKNGEAFNEPFTIYIRKHSSRDINFQLSYMYDSDIRNIHIASGKMTRQVEAFRYRFPYPSAFEESVVVTVSYRPKGTKEEDSVDTQIRVRQPPPRFRLPFFRDFVRQATHRKVVDINDLVSVANSVMNIVFLNQHHHAHEHLHGCSDEYCSDNGKCELMHRHWKACNCNVGRAGPTCAFRSRDEERDVIVLLREVLEAADHIQITEFNLVQVAELLRSVTSVRHIFSVDLIKTATHLVPTVLERLKNHVWDYEISEDLLVAIQNIGASLTARYYATGEVDNDFLYGFWHTALEQQWKAVDLLLKPLENNVEWRQDMENIGLTIHTFIPSHTKEDVTAITERRLITDPEFHEDTITVIPHDLVNDFRIRDEEIGMIVYDTEHNPHEVIQHDNVSVISNVISLKFKERNNLFEVPLVHVNANPPIHILFPRPEYREEHYDLAVCAWYNPFHRTWDSGRCLTEHELENRIVCLCHSIGDYALVLPIEASRDHVPHHGFDNVDIDNSRIHDKSVHPVFWLVILIVLWVFTLLAFQKDGEENGQFLENFTAHPLYSILFVNTSSIPNVVRVHLIFLTLGFQLWAESFLITPDRNAFILAFCGILFSGLTNYIFGIAARALTSGDKPTGKMIFIIVSEVILIFLFFFTDGHLQNHTHSEDHIFIHSFWLGLVLDLLILDSVVVAALGHVPALKDIIRFRGFYTEASVAAAGASSTLGYQQLDS